MAKFRVVVSIGRFLMRTLAETFITEAILPKFPKNKVHWQYYFTKKPVVGTFAITILPAEYAWVRSKEFVK